MRLKSDAVKAARSREPPAYSEAIKTHAPAGQLGRIQLLDVVRGVAIAGVAAYHFGWDLNLFGLLATDVTTHPGWVVFARSLAATFMLLVGINLTLAHRSGVRWPSFLRRLFVIAAAATVITVVTYALFPETYIYFGILHAIAVSSMLGLLFLRAHSILLVGAAVTLFLVPLYLRFEALNARPLAWTGLAASAPSSNDFVPVFPWFALPLVGILIARASLRSPRTLGLVHLHSNLPPVRFVAWTGRHSLAIYLMHQPLLLAALNVVYWLSAG